MNSTESQSQGTTLATMKIHPPLLAGALLLVTLLLHFMLPDSRLNPDRARLSPGAFCDTGLPLLLRELDALGARRDRLVVYLAGGASVLENRDFFDIGRKNALTAKRILWGLGLMVEDEEIGGERSRTLKLGLEQGRVTVRDSIGERELGSRALRRF